MIHTVYQKCIRQVYKQSVWSTLTCSCQCWLNERTINFVYILLVLLEEHIQYLPYVRFLELGVPSRHSKNGSTIFTVYNHTYFYVLFQLLR